MEKGITIGNATSEKFIEFKAADGTTQGLIARNRKQTETLTLGSKELQFSGLVLIARDGTDNELDPVVEDGTAED